MEESYVKAAFKKQKCVIQRNCKVRVIFIFLVPSHLFSLFLLLLLQRVH